MNVDQLLRWAQDQLEDAKIATARLDALVLLEDCSGINRAKLLYDPNIQLDNFIITKYKNLIKLRVTHIPIAYIRGKTEFYGRNFLINKHVLEPRPESETLIDELKNIIDINQANKISIIDVGTGSGALGITADLELHPAQIYATDINKSCLKIATQNALIYKSNIKFLHGNLIEPIPNESWDNNSIIIANLPYVPNNWKINTHALHEPKSAIFGGQDGLLFYRRLFKQVSILKKRPTYILTESMPPQHQELNSIASSYGFKLLNTNDFISIFS